MSHVKEFSVAESAVVVRWLRRASLLNVIRNWFKAKRRAEWERGNAQGGTTP